jgi:hypothetical protein
MESLTADKVLKFCLIKKRVMGSAIVGLSDTPLSAGAPPNQAGCSDRTWDCDREWNSVVLTSVYCM